MDTAPATRPVPPTPQDDAPKRAGAPERGVWIAATLLLALLAILLCLVPKPENDLFFELRIGTDILHSGRLPHVDTYSWTQRGAHWDVPEWGAFVLYALAFRAGGFFGTWLLMAVLTLAAAGVVWGQLARRLGLVWAWALTGLMLLAMSPCLQERPYAFTYPLLAVGLVLLARGRAGSTRALLWLIPLCAVWTNLHQGVLAFVCLILACAAGDALTAAGRRRAETLTAPDLLTEAGRERAQRDETDPNGWRGRAARARLMLGAATACAGAALLSPYGWGVYRSVFVTLRDHQLMANVTEWNPISVLPPSQLPPFVLVAVIAFGALALSPRRNLADLFMLAGLFAEALLHARNTALFAVGGTLIAAPHIEAVLGELRRRLPPGSRTRAPLLTAFALLCVAGAALACLAGLRRAAGPLGLSPEGIGEAVARVPTYPAAACAFLDAEGFPSNLRLLNNFEVGGYLLWRLPREPVFIDGRLDIYAGRTFDDMLVLSRAPASPAGAALVQKYDFDCVLTTSRLQARAFAANPQWQLVYADPPGSRSPHARLFLRRRPAFAALIARCLRDRPTY